MKKLLKNQQLQQKLKKLKKKRKEPEDKEITVSNKISKYKIDDESWKRRRRKC